MEYYMLVEEWNYPTKTGYCFVDCYNSYDEAKNMARELGKNEIDDFQRNCGGIHINGEYKSSPYNIGLTTIEPVYIITYSNNQSNTYFYKTVIIKRMIENEAKEI